MINALNLKLQVLITSFRLLKKPTQTYFLECKMLLIKYFSNTKAMGFLNTGLLFGRITTTKTSIAGNGRGTNCQLGSNETGSPRLWPPPLPGCPPITCTDSWSGSGTCTCTRHREVFVHSLGFFWSPGSAGPRETFSGTPPLQGTG